MAAMYFLIFFLLCTPCLASSQERELVQIEGARAQVANRVHLFAIQLLDALEFH